MSVGQDMNIVVRPFRWETNVGFRSLVLLVVRVIELEPERCRNTRVATTAVKEKSIILAQTDQKYSTQPRLLVLLMDSEARAIGSSNLSRLANHPTVTWPCLLLSSRLRCRVSFSLSCPYS